ncbi:MAG: hypothetical protein JWQ34_539 [Mucilaginibacter sp.]|nr:hypothetical protein [Mucilaginibacter sp.]
MVIMVLKWNQNGSKYTFNPHYYPKNGSKMESNGK